MRRPIVRLVYYLLGAAALVAALMAGGIRLDQYRLRWRAERLQSDIRSLELRKSTYADARRIINRWWNYAHEKGPCRGDWCDVEISLTDFAWDRSTFIGQTSARLQVFLWLGARPATVAASIRVRKGVVLGKTIGAYVGGPCHDFLCLAVIGHAQTGEHRFIDPRHPEYSFAKPGGCEYCVDAHVIFSPYASPDDVRRLTDVNFDCITQWTPCETEADILPTAWRQHQSEGALPPNAVSNCSETIRALSRELGRLPLATTTLVDDIGEGQQITVRWDEPGGVRRHESRRNSFPLPNGFRPQRGDRLLVYEDYVFAPFNTCAVVPATVENVRIARQGVSEELSDNVHALNLPFGEIHPPQVNIP